MAPIRNLKRVPLYQKHPLKHAFSLFLSVSTADPCGDCRQRKDCKEFSISHTHMHTWGWRDADISHNGEWNLPFRIHTCNASICSHKPGQNSISNRKKNKKISNILV